jgi:MFS family permease
LFGGQFLLNLADPNSFELFSLISILVSFAAIPILLTATPTPIIEQSESISLRKLFAWAPLGVVGCFLVNMCLAMVFGMAAVYARQIGMNIEEISYFMGAIIFGGLILQWPIGRISDHFDRRMVLAVTAALAAIFALLSTTTDKQNFVLLLLYSALFGGFVLPLYALCIALVNDFMRPQNIVAASGTVLMIGGIGSTVGPLAVAGVMDTIGPQGFFLSTATICTGVALYSVYRLLFHGYVKDLERHEFHIYAPAMVGTVLHAESEPFVESTPVEADINQEPRST